MFISLTLYSPKMCYVIHEWSSLLQMLKVCFRKEVKKILTCELCTCWLYPSIDILAPLKHIFHSLVLINNGRSTPLLLCIPTRKRVLHTSFPGQNQFLPVEHRSYNEIFKLAYTFLIPPPPPPPPLKLSPKTQKMSA